MERTIRLRGASAKSVKATILTHSHLHAHNTFDAPRTVEPRSQALIASVTKFEIELV